MRILKILLSLCITSWFSGIITAENSDQSPARMTDLFLRQNSFKNLTSPKTGTIYEGIPPVNLSGITVSALKLRTGNLRIKGVQYKEFQILAGVDVSPYVERLVLIYQNLGNWSSHFYELEGYIHLTPVLGLLAYNDLNLSATNLPELEFTASQNPISVKFSDVKSAPRGSKPICVKFDLHGFVSFNKVVLGNTCLSYNQGHFSIVAESIATEAADRSESESEQPLEEVKKKEMKMSVEMIVVGSAVGGLILIMILSFVILCILRLDCEKVDEVGGLVKMKCIGIFKRGRGKESSRENQQSLEIIHGL